MDLIHTYWTQIVSAVAGFAGGSLLTYSVTKKAVRGGGTLVDQAKSTVGRDQVGIKK